MLHAKQKTSVQLSHQEVVLRMEAKKGQDISSLSCEINRGYYMAARRYEISLRVLKNISRVSAANERTIFSTREEKFRISKRPCDALFNI